MLQLIVNDPFARVEAHARIRGIRFNVSKLLADIINLTFLVVRVCVLVKWVMILLL